MSQRLPPVEYELEFDTGSAAWSVYRLRAEEGLNCGYSVVVDATTEDDAETDTLLGADAVLRIGRAGEDARELYGIVSRLDYLGFVERRLCVRFHLAPAFELMRQRVDSRIWQHKSVREIVREVLTGPLDAHGRSVDFGETQRGSSPRDYCVQYRESDLDFVTRLLEEEGISHVFVHESDTGRETLTLRDDNAQYPELTDADGSVELPIILHNIEEANTESVQRFEWSRALTSTASLRRDFDWHTPKQLLTKDATASDERSRTRRRYFHGDRRYISDDQAQQSSDLQRAAALGGGVARGRSNATVLQPGFKFKVTSHRREDLVDIEWVITKVIHTGARPDIAPLADLDGPRYSNEFECVPVQAEIRPPRRTPKPRVYGPQTAIVTGDEAEEIFTDKHGRIQVQFHWEEQPSYASGSSCWVRCAQSMAGSGWGTQFIPRVGMEVVVEFLEGNPDRPLVTGCVYNGTNSPPFALPDNKTQSGWRTNSSPRAAGSNELRFDDAAGNEEIYLHGQKNWNIAIGNDKAQSIGHDESRTVGRNEQVKVGNDQQLDVGQNQSAGIGANQSISVGKNQSLTVGGAQTITVAAAQTETIGLAHTQTIGAIKTVSVGGMCNYAVGASYNLVVVGSGNASFGGASKITVGRSADETVVGNKTVSANDIRVSAKGNYTVNAGKRMVLSSTQDMKLQSRNKLTALASDDVVVQGKKTGRLRFDKKLVLECGKASITLKKNGDVVIKGANISVTGSGDVKLKGNKVKSN